MPRAKVKPEDRKRGVAACSRCKLSKIRCDSKSPCNQCVRRGCGAQCEYQGLQPYSRSAGRSVPQSPASTNGPRVDRQSSVTNSPSAITVSQDLNVVDDVDDDDVPIPSTKRAPGRVLFSSAGEKVYIGGSASLSCLHIIRQLVKQHLGPCLFIENAFSNSMLEMEPCDPVMELTEPTRDEKQVLLENYLQASLGLSRQSNAKSKAAREKLASLYIIFAIGGQCRSMDPATLQHSARYFAMAQRIAFEGLLCEPSIAMLQVFTLMAFYLMSACRRNAAFMYLGVACKAACSLGLQGRDSHTPFDKNELERLKIFRIFKSLQVLDLIVSALLGRPTSISSIHSLHLSKNKHGIGDATTQVMAASIEACSYLSELELKKWEGTTSDAVEAEEFLHRLQKWSLTLPSNLRSFNYDATAPDDSNTSPETRIRLLGAIHLSCIYYFTVMLVTRPFLLCYLVQKLRRNVSSSSSRRSRLQDLENFPMANLSHACHDAAIYMANMAEAALDAGLLLGNMCIIEAWTFTAGLVLGFVLFAEDVQQQSDPATNKAFKAAQRVLQRFAEMSPQAMLYTDILNNFAVAISNYKQKNNNANRRKPSSQLVNEIFSLNFEPTTTRMTSANTHETSHLSPVSNDVPVTTGNGSDVYSNNKNTYSSDQESPEAAGFAMDGMDLSMTWDDLMLDMPPFGTFFDGGFINTGDSS